MPFDFAPTKPDSEVVTVLRKARALIDSPEKWCKVDFSQNDERFCIVGAIIRSVRIYDHNEAMRTIDRVTAPLKQAAGQTTLMCWNDAPERTHAEVMEAFDRAIILAGGTP